MMRQLVIETFKKRFNKQPDVISFAPGRLEFLGNHTDYNEGFVLSTAIGLGTFFVACKVDSGDQCTVVDAGDGSERTFSLENMTREKEHHWSNYIKGVLSEIQVRDYEVPAFEGMFLSNVPKSADMGSSAALEIAVAYGVGNLVDESIFDKIDAADWARMGQSADQKYEGLNCGLLNQLTSILGKKNSLVFSDFRTLNIKTINLPDDIALVVANTMINPEMEEEYNEHRRCCEEAARYFKSLDPTKVHLRDVCARDLEEHRDDLAPTVYKRAKHVIGENDRVLQGVGLLKMDCIEEFGQLMHESHHSSRVYFENSCEELDILVEEGKKLKGHIGARLSGGGFGGVSLHLVDKSAAKSYSKALKECYETQTGKEVKMLICSPDDGAFVGCP